MTRVFVPLSDELMYDHPELIRGPITAFDPSKVLVFQEHAVRLTHKHKSETRSRQHEKGGSWKTLADLGYPRS